MQQKLVPFNLLFPSNFNLRLQIANSNPSPADFGENPLGKSEQKKSRQVPKRQKVPGNESVNVLKTRCVLVALEALQISMGSKMAGSGGAPP